MYKVTDTFTTQDGRWDRHSEPFDILPEKAQQYGTDDFTAKGCATCLFVKIVGGPARHVRFFVPGGPNEIKEINSSGWANIPIFHSSAYNPDRGELGPWHVKIENHDSQEVVGLGLPFSWHVSNFVVFEWVEEGEDGVDIGDEPEEPTPQPEPESPIAVTIELTRNGVKEVYKGVVTKI